MQRRGRGYISAETRTVMKFAGGGSASKTDEKEKEERRRERNTGTREIREEWKYVTKEEWETRALIWIPSELSSVELESHPVLSNNIDASRRILLRSNIFTRS